MTFYLGSSYGCGHTLGIYVHHKDGGGMPVGVVERHPTLPNVSMLKATQHGKESGLFPSEFDGLAFDQHRAMTALNNFAEGRPLNAD